MENDIKKDSKLSIPGAIVIMGLLIMLGIIISKSPSKKVDDSTSVAKQNTTISGPVPVAPLSDKDHIRGNKKIAKILIIEFSDLECPFCKSFHPILKQAMEKYPGQIVWVYRHYPLETLHSKARNEARATECVNKLSGNDTFWKYVDMIYENTPGNDGLDPNLLPVFAEKVGVDKVAFNKCMIDDQAEMDKIIDANLLDGKNSKLQGTPHSIIITKDQQQIPINGSDGDTLNAALNVLLK